MEISLKGDGAQHSCLGCFCQGFYCSGNWWRGSPTAQARTSSWPTSGKAARAQPRASILSLVLDYDALVSQRKPSDAALQILQQRSRRYGSGLVKDFATHLGATVGQMQVVEIPLRLVRPGMTILQDVRTELGTLLVPRGFEVTERFTERARNFGPGLLAEKVTVSVPAKRAP